MLVDSATDRPPFSRILVCDPDRLSGLANGQDEMRDLLDGNGVTVLFLREPDE